MFGSTQVVSLEKQEIYWRAEAETELQAPANAANVTGQTEWTLLDQERSPNRNWV